MYAFNSLLDYPLHLKQQSYKRRGQTQYSAAIRAKQGKGEQGMNGQWRGQGHGSLGTNCPRKEGRVRAREQRAVCKERQGDEKGYLNKHWAVPTGPPLLLGLVTGCPGKCGSPALPPHPVLSGGGGTLASCGGVHSERKESIYLSGNYCHTWTGTITLR